MRKQWERMPSKQNLKPWQPGQSGNPAGKPKGTKHLSTYIKELMTDDEFEITLRDNKTKQVKFEGIPVRALIYVAMQKALDGDVSAMNWLAKYGWKQPLDPPQQQNILVITRQKTQSS